MQHFNSITVALALLCAQVYSQSLSIIPSVIIPTVSTSVIPVPIPVPTTSVVAVPVPIPSTSVVSVPIPVPTTSVVAVPVPVPSTSVVSVPVPVPVPSPAQIFVTDPTCPKSNGNYYRSTKFNAEFRIACPAEQAKMKRQSIVDAYISRFSDCIDVCDPSTLCLGMLFNPKTLACAGYKCQPAAANNSWAADMTAKGGVSIDNTPCSSNQESQILFNVQNALLNSANSQIPTSSTKTVTTGTTATATASPVTSPKSGATSSTSTSTVTSVALTTIGASSAPSGSSPAKQSTSTTSYTGPVVQTNAANIAAVPQLLAGVAAIVPFLGL